MTVTTALPTAYSGTLDITSSIPGVDDDLAALASRGVAELAVEDPALHALLTEEQHRQRDTLMMVAASSVAPASVLAASGASVGNLTTEGYPGRRFHAGCGVADRIEQLAVERAKSVFGARYVNVQPHSGSSANLSVLMSVMSPGDVVLGMELDCGGHLTHGSPASISGRYFTSVGYHVGPDGFIDLAEVAELADKHRPRVIVCGASAYPRAVDFAAFREIADRTGALLLADISHVAGLVAAGLHPDPIDSAHVVTTSTYKQLYGPRGGLVMSGRDADGPAPHGKGTLAQFLQRAVFPFSQGTPSMAAVAAKARALDFVSTPRFAVLAHLLRADARAIADQLSTGGLTVVTGGTDIHMVLIDLRPIGLTGDIVEQTLERCDIIVNRNRVPGDTTPVRVTGGIRIGTNSLAARGITPVEARECADLVLQAIALCRAGRQDDRDALAAIAARVATLTRLHPLTEVEGSTVAAPG